MTISARLIAIAATLLVLLPARSVLADEWTCSLDLDRGRKASLKFSRTTGKISGTLTEGTSQPQAVAGTWEGSTIEFERRLDAGSIQPFAGIAKASGAGEVRMGGRYAARFSGVWSADCRASGAVDPPTPPSQPPTGEPTQPTPPQPTSTTGSCSISGKATGPRAGQATQFIVMLFGPNNDRAHKATVRFQAGAYRFTSLPDGEYVIRTDTKGDLGFSPTPANRRVRCAGGAITGQDFNFP